MRDIANNPEIRALNSVQDGTRQGLGAISAKLATEVITRSRGPFTNDELFFRCLYGFDPDTIESVPCTEATYELSELLMKLRKPELVEELTLVQSVTEGNRVGELGFFPGSTSLFRLKLKDLTTSAHPEDDKDPSPVIVGMVEVAVRQIPEPLAEVPMMDKRVSPVKIAEVKTRYEGRAGMYREAEDVGHIAIGWEEITKAPHSNFASSDVASLVIALHNYQMSDLARSILGDM